MIRGAKRGMLGTKSLVPLAKSLERGELADVGLAHSRVPTLHNIPELPGLEIGAHAVLLPINGLEQSGRRGRRHLPMRAHAVSF